MTVKFIETVNVIEIGNNGNEIILDIN